MTLYIYSEDLLVFIKILLMITQAHQFLIIHEISFIYLLFKHHHIIHCIRQFIVRNCIFYLLISSESFFYFTVIYYFSSNFLCIFLKTTIFINKLNSKEYYDNIFHISSNNIFLNSEFFNIFILIS